MMKISRGKIMNCEKLLIDGMSCHHCVAALNQELSKLNLSIREIQIGYAEIEYDENIVSIADLENAVSSAGFKLISHKTLDKR